MKMHPIVLDTTEANSVEQLKDLHFDTVIVAVGMDRSRYRDVYQVYVNGLKNVLKNMADSVLQVIYLSSTGVYGDFGGNWVDENSPTDPQRDGGKACLGAEKLLKESRFRDRATILRMAGLYGNERIPTKTTVADKQWDRLSAAGYLNLIHVDDAVSSICAVTDKKLTGETFLVSDSNPTLRRDYYQYLADMFNLGPIPWDETATPDPDSRSSSSKRISNRKLLTQTGLKLKHADFRSGLRSSIP
jgi:nucleoside-diphosphate-sugar epimerase